MMEIFVVALFFFFGVGLFVWSRLKNREVTERPEELVPVDQHEIVRTWFTDDKKRGMLLYQWECSCGKTGDHLTRKLAQDQADGHVRAENYKLEMMKKNGEPFAW